MSGAPQPQPLFAENYLETINAWHRFTLFASLIGFTVPELHGVQMALIRHGAETLRDLHKTGERP